jgi:DnaJ-class molecular chaperone
MLVRGRGTRPPAHVACGLQEFHPDRHRGGLAATARFQTIQQAYEVLSDQDQRRLYDVGLVDYLGVEVGSQLSSPLLM